MKKSTILAFIVILAIIITAILMNSCSVKTIHTSTSFDEKIIKLAYEAMKNEEYSSERVLLSLSILKKLDLEYLQAEMSIELINNFVKKAIKKDIINFQNNEIMNIKQQTILSQQALEMITKTSNGPGRGKVLDAGGFNKKDYQRKRQLNKSEKYYRQVGLRLMQNL
jgi:hypothetical protein